MIIGVPKEIKNNENRVSITPSGIHTLVSHGHTIYIETNAGSGSGFSDEDYQAAGGLITSKDEVFAQSDLIVKVKEYLDSEYHYLCHDQMVFTYLHIAANEPFAKALIDSGTTSIAYETVSDRHGKLPLLTPMSQVAGRMAVQVGAWMLQKANGGSGVLLGGVPGVRPANVMVLGGGTVGFEAARMANGLGANVELFEKDIDRMAQIDELTNGSIHTIYSTPYNIALAVKDADLVIGAVLLPGAKTPKLVSDAMVRTMKKGSAIVDVSIDQGGCIETCDHTTDHDHPTFQKYGVNHYSVANMPGAVPYTSTVALSNATLPYIVKLADQGLAALRNDEGFLNGLNTYNGQYTNKAVADALHVWYVDPHTIL